MKYLADVIFVVFVYFAATKYGKALMQEVCQEAYNKQYILEACEGVKLELIVNNKLKTKE